MATLTRSRLHRLVLTGFVAVAFALIVEDFVSLVAGGSFRGLAVKTLALRMQQCRTKPLRGGLTAPSPMEIEWLDPRPLDAPRGVFGVTEGSSHGRIKVTMR